MVAVKAGQVKMVEYGYQTINNMVELVGQNNSLAASINITIQMDILEKYRAEFLNKTV